MIRREFSIAEGTLLFISAYVLSAGLGIIRQALFNAEFGAGMEASAYYAAFRLPDTIASLIGGGALSNAMIPALLDARYESGDIGEQRLVNLAATTLSVAVSLVVLVCMIFAPFFVRFVLAPGFDAESATLTVALTRIMLAQLVLVVLASVAIAALNARNQFLLTAISIVTHNVTMIGGILAARFLSWRRHLRSNIRRRRRRNPATDHSVARTARQPFSRAPGMGSARCAIASDAASAGAKRVVVRGELCWRYRRYGICVAGTGDRGAASALQRQSVDGCAAPVDRRRTGAGGIPAHRRFMQRAAIGRVCEARSRQRWRSA